MDKKVLYSLLITLGIVFGTLVIVNIIFQVIFGEDGVFIALFASTIFILIYCTQLILSKLDENIDK